jgi:hypothetical protein
VQARTGLNGERPGHPGRGGCRDALG